MATDPRPCKECGASHPLTTQYWVRDQRHGGWRARCKTCLNAKRRERRKQKVRETRAKSTVPPEVRVVEDAKGNRRALRYWEDGPRVGETFVGYGSKLLTFGD